MASGWTTSGIDWTSASTMRNSRTEQIVTELYKATLERNFWIKTVQSSSIVPVVLYKKIRMDTQLRYIYETFEKWFRPLINGNDSPFALNLEYSPFVNDGDGLASAYPNSAVTSFSIPYGKGSYDYSSGGDLSSLVSYDMSFLGAIGNRVNLNHLYSFYTILNLPLMCRLQRLTQNVNYITSPNLSALFAKVYASTGSQSGTEAQVKAVLNNIPLNDSSTSVGYSLDLDININQSRFALGSFGSNYDSYFAKFNNYNISDFDILSYSYGAESYGSLPLTLDIAPVNPYNAVVLNKFENATIGGSTEACLSPSPNININSFSGVLSASVQVNYLSQNFLNINNELLLDYYTETP